MGGGRGSGAGRRERSSAAGSAATRRSSPGRTQRRLGRGPRSRSAASMAFRAYYRYVPKGTFTRRIHGAAQQPRHVRPAGDARRGDVCARDVRRDAERGVGGSRRAMNCDVPDCSAIAVAHWSRLAAIADASPSTPCVRRRTGQWRSSDGVLARPRRRRARSRPRSTSSGLRGHWVTLEDVSPALQSAIVSGEDQRFYEHAGVDWARARGRRMADAAGRRAPRREHDHDAARGAA